MAKLSTDLRTQMLGDKGFKELMDGSELRIFAVAQGGAPASADAAETGTLLMKLSAGGTGAGLTFDTPVDGVISKTASEVWTTAATLAAGICAYFRLVKTTDGGAASASEPRVQGFCGLVGTDMVLTQLNVAAGVPWTLNYFNVALPTD